MKCHPHHAIFSPKPILLLACTLIWHIQHVWVHIQISWVHLPSEEYLPFSAVSLRRVVQYNVTECDPKRKAFSIQLQSEHHVKNS